MKTILLHADVIGLMVGFVFAIIALVATIKAVRANPYQYTRSVWIVVAFWFAICALTAAFVLPGVLVCDARKQGIYLSR